MNPAFLIITHVPAPAVTGVAGSPLTSQNYCFGGWRLEAGGWSPSHYPQILPVDLVKSESFRIRTQL